MAAACVLDLRPAGLDVAAGGLERRVGVEIRGVEHEGIGRNAHGRNRTLGVTAVALLQLFQNRGVYRRFAARPQLLVPAPRPLGWTDLPGPFGSEFRKAMLDIVGRLYPKLDALKERLEERQRAAAEATRLAQAQGQSIYLHGRVEHAPAWEQAALALTENGYAVVPGEPDPVESDPKRLQEVRERRVEAMSGCA